MTGRSTSNRPAVPYTRNPLEDDSSRTRFAFLAETSRCLADSLDLQTTLATVAGLALPHFGAWCMVDIVEPDHSIARVAVIHPDPEKQLAARNFYRDHPPGRDDPIGAPRVIRTQQSEFAPVAEANILDDIADATHRDLLRQLGAQSFLTVPMRARGRTRGAITFVSDELRRYDDADLLLAEDLGRRCAMAIDNALLYGLAEEARQLAESVRETATFEAQRANALRELADSARQEAEAATRAKATLLTTMSHEFRTPLGAILGFVGLLNDGLAGPLAPVQQDYIRRIGNAGGNLLRLIEEMLTLSQVHAGHGTIFLEDVDLSGVVRDVAELIQPLASAKHLAINLELPDAPLILATDGAKFRQIVINLAGNAVKFTKTGEVRLILKAAPGAVILQVTDSGEGIAPADIERIFESFVQAGSSKRRGSEGTGLGLAITRQLARLMHGDVSVESVLGTGSTFTVRLPAERLSDASDVRTSRPRQRRGMLAGD